MVRKGAKLKTVRDFLKWESLLADSVKQILLSYPCPETVLGVAIPRNLDSLTMEQLCQLWTIKSSEELFMTVADVFLHMSRRAIMKAPLMPVMGLVNMVATELPKVNDLWESIPSSHTQEEMMAGISSLNFGIFGIIDWYARRMGITNHDEVLATKWVRIYQCMKNDAEEAMYRKRLNEITIKKQKK